LRVPDQSAPCWIDGKRTTAEHVRLGIDDPTVLAGLGLFETCAVLERRVLELEPHLRRLVAGADRLGLARPEIERLRDYLVTAAEELAFRRGWLKLILTGRGTCVVFGASLPAESELEPASAVLLPWRRNPCDPLAGLKTLNYAPNLLGLAAAEKRGADEGIWLNTRGHLAEGCWSNLFLVQGRKLFTASERDGILPGILRGLTLEAARSLGLAVHEGKLRLRRLEQAREAFLTSSLAGVRPLVRYNGRPIGTGSPGPVTRRLSQEVQSIRLREETAPSGAAAPRDVERGVDAVHVAPRRER